MNKYFITPLRQRFLTLWVNQNQMAEWLTNWNFFFILAFGRSGTAFLADLLDKASGVYVFHEPVLEDFFAHARVHHNPKDAEWYMEGFRKREIFTRMRHISKGVYGEVNSTIRCHASALKKSFPNATLIHLVRDGRDVIRSTVGRRTMTFRNPFSMSIHPNDTDPWKNQWPQMDRFARLCWFWQEENRRLRSSIGKTVQFEKILTDYEYFRSEVLEPCGIQIDQAVWETEVSKPRNTTKDFSMPKWDQWTAERQKTFREICGEEMTECGYSF